MSTPFEPKAEITRFLDASYMTQKDMYVAVSQNPHIECILISTHDMSHSVDAANVVAILSEMPNLHTLIVIGFCPIGALGHRLFGIPNVRTLFDLTGHVHLTYDNADFPPRTTPLKVYFTCREPSFIAKQCPGYELQTIPMTFNMYKAPILQSVMPKLADFDLSTYLKTDVPSLRMYH